MTQPPPNGFGQAQPYPPQQPYGHPAQQPYRLPCAAAAYPSQPYGYAGLQYQPP